MKINNPISDQGTAKFYGILPVFVDSATAENKLSTNKKEYTQVTLDVTIDTGSDAGTKKKLFFRLPWDNWTRPGEPESLFRQFRAATELTADQCNDTKNYEKVGFYALVAPETNYADGSWKTFTNKDGKKKLSFGITQIFTAKEMSDKAYVDLINKQAVLLVSRAMKEVEGKTAGGYPSAAEAGFDDPMKF